MSGADKNKSAKGVSSWGAAKIVVRQYGILGLWKGFNLHLARDVAGGAVFFGVYESCKQALGTIYGNEMRNTPWAIPLAGAICGVSSWVVVCTRPTVFLRTLLISFLDLPNRHHENKSSEPVTPTTSGSRRCQDPNDSCGKDCCKSSLQTRQMARSRNGDSSISHPKYDSNDRI